MRVECKENKGDTLPKDFRQLGYFPETRFDVEIGRDYIIYGMSLRRHVLRYLIDPQESNLPNWYPINLFTIKDAVLPKVWKFSFDPRCQESGVSAVWGYEELVLSPKHFDGLLEREAFAIEEFSRRKQEMNRLD